MSNLPAEQAKWPQGEGKEGWLASDKVRKREGVRECRRLSHVNYEDLPRERDNVCALPVEVMLIGAVENPSAAKMRRTSG